MDVEFNSLKYVWNFLREEFPKKPLLVNPGHKHKYENEKGGVPHALVAAVFGRSDERKAEAISIEIQGNRFCGMQLFSPAQRHRELGI